MGGGVHGSHKEMWLLAVSQSNTALLSASCHLGEERGREGWGDGVEGMWGGGEGWVVVVERGMCGRRRGRGMDGDGGEAGDVGEG